MRKILFLLCILGSLAFVCTDANAGVSFIVQPSGGNENDTSSSQTHACLLDGYQLRSCPSGYFPNKRCPDDATFYDKCCDMTIYKYSSSNICVKIGMLPKDECGGKYSCVEP